MIRIALLACMAAAVAILNTPSVARAGDHIEWVSDNGLIIHDTDNMDVVSVAEPVYYAPAPVQTSYVVQPAYAPASDTIVTPYGYTPVFNSGYYQGYGYAPQYAFNPYYAGAAYTNSDPLTAAVVSAVASAASNGGNIGTGSVLQSLIAGILGSQTQPVGYAQPVYGGPVYVQPAYVQPVYVQQVYAQRVYAQPVYAQPVYAQPVYVQRYVQHVYRERTYVPPVYSRQVYSAPAPVIQYRRPEFDRGGGRGDGERGRGDGERGHGHHGDHD